MLAVSDFKFTDSETNQAQDNDVSHPNLLID